MSHGAAGSHMPDHQTISSIVRGHALRLTSSSGLGWKHILVERYLVDPEEKAETISNCHIVVMANGNEVCHGERPGSLGHMVPYQKEPGTINLYENGLQPAITPFNPTDLTLCAIDKEFAARVAEELGCESTPIQKIGFRDSSMEYLMTLLADEAEYGGISGISYADHLTYALTTRLLLAGNERERPRLVEPSFPSHRLKRVIRLMEANLDRDLSLQILADESGYSIGHFLRLFRSAIGFTPHQYLVYRRIEKAKEMMKNTQATLIEIALECGFASHAHFSRAFRRMLNVTPSYYRRHM